jgi:hypothetical protein
MITTLMTPGTSSRRTIKTLISHEITNQHVKHKPHLDSKSYLAKIERGQGEMGVASFGELTAISDAKQIDEVIIVGPSPHWRCRYPALPSNP